MNTSISAFIQQLVSSFKKLSKGAKIAIFTVLGTAIIAAVVITVVLNTGKYTVLYRGLSSYESVLLG